MIFLETEDDSGMIEMFTALQAESSGLIRRLELSRIQNSPFRQYGGDGICLTITGPGKNAAAAAVGMVLGNCPKEQLPYTQLVNFGSCGRNDPEGEDSGGDSGTGEPPGEEDSGTGDSHREGRPAAGDLQGEAGLFLINKLTDADTRRTFYPDLLLETSLAEASLVTVSRPWFGERGRTGAVQLYDMEGAAIYEAGHFFLRPDQLHFLKGVTDRGTKDGLPDREEFTQRMDVYAEQALPFLEALRLSPGYNMEQSAEKRSAADEKLTASIAAAVHASAAMEHEIRQLVQYGTLAGLDVSSLIPPACRNRREGKEALEELRRVIQGIG